MLNFRAKNRRSLFWEGSINQRFKALLSWKEKSYLIYGLIREGALDIKGLVCSFKEGERLFKYKFKG